MVMIQFAKLREGAVIPSKREEDSDYDLYACFEEAEFVMFEERGSNTKWCGIVQAGVIDSGYRGEWLCAIYNGNPVPVHISKAVGEVQRLEDRVLVPYGKAICQFHVREIPKIGIEEVSADAVLACASERGAGRLGSSGK